MSASMMKREEDWCFLCLTRKTKLVAICYSLDSETQRNKTQFIRICTDCIKRALKITEDNKIEANIVLDETDKHHSSVHKRPHSQVS